MSDDRPRPVVEIAGRDRLVVGVAYALLLALLGWVAHTVSRNTERLARLEATVELMQRR